MKVYGLVGEKLSHSLSPKIHNIIFEKLNIDCTYNIFEVSKNNIDNLKLSLNVLGVKGVNVTIPYKEKVMEDLDYISKEGREIGAVNTILNKDGEFKGYNTDYYGFKYMLEWKKISLNKKTVVILGTGGASKAVVSYALNSSCKEIFLVSRNKKEYPILNSKIKIINYNELNEIKGDILINTTPVGMYPNSLESPVNKKVIKNYNILIDLIYNPLETKFLKIGKELGLETLNGLMMLVGQAVKAEEIWQDKEINKKIIIDIYNSLEKEFS